MLPAVGYFKSIVCPYFENESCERPHCQFRHEHLPVRAKPTLALKSKSCLYYSTCAKKSNLMASSLSSS